MEVVGAVGLQMDAAARAEFFGAGQVLDAADARVSLTEIARAFVRQQPALDSFLKAKRVAENRASRTVENLRVALTRWLDDESITFADELTRERRAASSRAKNSRQIRIQRAHRRAALVVRFDADHQKNRGVGQRRENQLRDQRWLSLLAMLIPLQGIYFKMPACPDRGQ